MEKIIQIEVGKLIIDPQNPRKDITKEEIGEMADSLQSNKQQEHIKVEDLKDTTYLITEGTRRAMGGLLIKQRTKKPFYLYATVENKLNDIERLQKRIAIDAQKKNWTTAERDTAWEKLWKAKKTDKKEFAKLIGVSEGIIVAFLDRVSLGKDFVKSLDNLSAYNITETERIKDKDLRKEVLKAANKQEMQRKEIRGLVGVMNDGSIDKTIKKEVLQGKISVSDAQNMKGLTSKEQSQALNTTKAMNAHKKKLSTYIKEKKVDAVSEKKIKEVSELLHDFQKEFFDTSSKIKRMRSKLEFLQTHDLEKYIDTPMQKILSVCLDELKTGILPAINEIEKKIGGKK